MPWFSIYHNQKLSNDFVKVLENSKPDLVFVEFSYTLPMIYQAAQKFPDIKFILDAHNIEHQLHHKIASNATNPALKAYKHLYAYFLKKIEASADKYIDTIVAVSEEEAADWKKLCPSAKIVVASNGVDTDYFKKPKQSTPSQESLVFCGLMDYRPNVDAMEWFVDQIWPIIHKNRPQCQLYIVGRNPTKSIQAMAKDPSITVTGQVDDVREWVAKSTMAIVPLRSGAGTRLKILEAMAMEKVIVSTTIGAEGLHQSDGVVIADQPAAFAEQVLRILNLSDRQQLEKHNRALVEQHYSWQLIVQKLRSDLHLQAKPKPDSANI